MEPIDAITRYTASLQSTELSCCGPPAIFESPPKKTRRTRYQTISGGRRARVIGGPGRRGKIREEGCKGLAEAVDGYSDGKGPTGA